MDSESWAQLHGASVHFPVALVLCSAALDFWGMLFPGLAGRRGLHAAGYWTMLLGAAGTVPAVLSGLVMSRGVLLGHDTLRLHHLFAWPAFALVAGLANWRVLGGEPGGRRPPAGYLAAAIAAAVLVSAAGYFGGEMMMRR
jgi:uncharacterized membrane protein